MCISSGSIRESWSRPNVSRKPTRPRQTPRGSDNKTIYRSSRFPACPPRVATARAHEGVFGRPNRPRITFRRVSDLFPVVERKLRQNERICFRVCHCAPSVLQINFKALRWLSFLLPNQEAAFVHGANLEPNNASRHDLRGLLATGVQRGEKQRRKKEYMQIRQGRRQARKCDARKIKIALRMINTPNKQRKGRQRPGSEVPNQFHFSGVVERIYAASYKHTQAEVRA